MEQKIVPTSPRSEYKQSVHASIGTPSTIHHARSTFVIVIMSILLGAAAGFFGFMIAATIPSDWPLLGALNVSELFRREQDQVLFTSLRGGTSVAEQAPEVLQQVVSLYASTPTREEDALNTGNALVLTADGWMVTPTTVYNQHGTEVNAPVVVLSNGEATTVIKAVEDELTGLTFFRVDELSLSFAQFTSDQSLRIGQNIAVVEKDLTGVTVSEDRIVGEGDRLVGPRRTSNSQNTTQTNNTHRAGAPVFTSNGQSVGIMRDETTLIPASLVQSALQSITTSGDVQRTARDITYVNLASVTDNEKIRMGLPDAGIEIIAIDRVQDLEQGDVIVNINNVGVDEHTDLGTVLHSKPAGMQWRMSVVRNGSEVIIDVKS